MLHFFDELGNCVADKSNTLCDARYANAKYEILSCYSWCCVLYWYAHSYRTHSSMNDVSRVVKLIDSGKATGNSTLYSIRNWMLDLSFKEISSVLHNFSISLPKQHYPKSIRPAYYECYGYKSNAFIFMLLVRQILFDWRVPVVLPVLTMHLFHREIADMLMPQQRAPMTVIIKHYLNYFRKTRSPYRWHSYCCCSFCYPRNARSVQTRTKKKIADTETPKTTKYVNNKIFLVIQAMICRPWM